jgi:hypothetical protein
VSGLHALADEGPGALADRRLGRPAILRGGRRAVLVQMPAGVVGVRTRSASPWAEPLLETAASLMAGNAVLLAPSAPLTGERIAAAFLRAGVPGELVAVLHGPAADALPEPVDAGGDEAKATVLVLGGAPLDAVVTGALWAAFAGAGRHPGAVGRLVVEAGSAGPLLEQLVAGARRLRLGDPEHADDRAHGERVARGLGADLAWVNEHGHAVPSVPVRLARHVRPRRLASQPSRLRSARWLPYDPSLVRARTAVARLLHGRQSERVAALREGALPLTRTALRVARDAAQPAKRSGSSGDAPR